MNQATSASNFTLILVQYYIETVLEEFIEADTQNLNSPYSNVRAMAQKGMTRTYKIKEFASATSERLPNNQIVQTFTLYNENKNKTSTITPEGLMTGINKVIGNFKAGEKFRDKPIFYWKHAIIFRIKYNSNVQEIIECKFPFSNKSLSQFKENLIRVYSQQFKLNFYEANKPAESAMQQNIATVAWTDLEFLNKKICFKIKDEYHVIPCEESSTQLQELKQILFKKSQLGLQINTSEKPFQIVNDKVLLNVIKFLNIQYKFTNKALSVPEFNECLRQLKELQQLVKSYFPKDEYINKLISYHCIDFPIIPVIELNNFQDEPSYIFTFRKKGNLYLIWENKFNGRATYIFSTTKNDYSKSCQRLFDFISADLRAKRKGIKHYEKELSLNGQHLNLKKKIVHNNYNSWCSNLMISLEFGK